MTQTPNSWICTVCGYVHEGDAPPDVCPVCGATADLFEPYHAPQAPASPVPVNRWRCLNCEYIHEGEAPPDFCPVCGAPAERFEVYAGAPVVVRSAAQPGRIVIAGAGIAGVSAAEAIRKAAPDTEITLISREAHLPYYRLNLTRYLAGEVSGDGLSLHPPEWYETNRIALLSEVELCGVDPDGKHLRLRNSENLAYDKLVLAIGSHPFVPPFPGASRGNVTPLRTKDHADLILEQCLAGSRCVVIGGGLLGLETAGALAGRGVEVALLEGHGWLLPRQLNERAARILEERVRQIGVTIHGKARAEELLGDERVREVLLESGERLATDMVVVATGVRSNSYIARLAGLEVNRGVVVDNSLCSSHPDILAAGDVAEHHGVNYGTWGPSLFQGTIAGGNAVGGRAQFAGIPRANMLKVLGYDLFSIGQTAPEDASYATCEVTEEDSGNHCFFMFRDSHMVGAILMGDTRMSGQAKHVIERGVDCSVLLRRSPRVPEVLDFIAGTT